MRELIGRLDVVDNTAASALRVIEHFDSLTEARASAPALQRAAAALAGCPVGVHDASAGTTRVLGPNGGPIAGAGSHGPGHHGPGDHGPGHHRPGDHGPGDHGPGDQGTARALTDPGQGWSVWLDRSGPGGPLDELILERLLRALKTRDPRRGTDGRRELEVRVACDADLGTAERRQVLEVLGLSGPVMVTVVAAQAELGASRTAVVGGHRIALTGAADPMPTYAAGLRAGCATVDCLELPTGLARALLAHRLAATEFGATGPVSHASLGSLAALASQLSPEQAASMPEVVLLRRTEVDHPWVPPTLHAVIGQPSARRAAAVLCVHHSTLQERMTWLEGRLGYSLHTAAGRHRASLALSLWRIAKLTD